MMHSAARALVPFALVVAAASCADDGPKFSVNYAPGFVKDGVRVSVFGVFRDGRMNPEAWAELGPRFSAALHREDCDIAISAQLRAQHASTYARFDDLARAEGITDELLDKVAPAATGDSILVLTVAGRPPGAKDGGASTSSNDPGPSMSSMGRGGGRGGRGGGGAPRPASPRAHHAPDHTVFEISASLFSKRQHESVAMVAMTYTGASEDEAVAKFLEKLGGAFPGAVCAGWNPDLPSP